MASQTLDGLIEREQVPSNDGRVTLSGADRAKPPPSTRARCAASIFASWGRKSQ
jgi:hypothetical protein